MKYMLLIYGEEQAEDFDGSEAAFEPWMKYSQDAAEAGVLEGGAGLHPTSTATTVRVRDGEVVTTDGPFAETREQLGGYYLLECADLDEALAWASRIPSVTEGSVEVRPVMEGP